MAFKLGGLSIPDMELPKFDPPDYNYGQAPRKIQLTDKEEKRIEKIIQILDVSDVDLPSIYNFFKEWQSSKTKSMKRFVLSISFVLTLAFIAGVSITDVDLFGVIVAEGREIIFLSSLIAIHICSFIYHLYLRSIDWDVHQANIIPVEAELKKYEDLIDEIDEIVEKQNIRSVEALFDDFRAPITSMHSSEEDTYKAIKFYVRNLKKSHDKVFWGDMAELFVIWALGVMGLFAIIFSF